MKKMFLAVTACLLLVCVSGFTIHQPSSGKKHFKKGKARTNGPVWINCNRGYVHSCDYVERYYIVDGEPGDTYAWYWDPVNPAIPTQYLGSNTYADVQLSVGDVILVTVNSEYYGQYDYWDTAVPCED